MSEQSDTDPRAALRGEDPADRPSIKLRPNKGRRLMSGAPWVYADEIAMDRRTRALPAGSLARVTDGERVFGLVTINTESQIAARLIDPDPDAIVDADWFARRLQRALALRLRLAGKGFDGAPIDPAFCRLIHAESDGLPGLVIDRFGTAVVIQPNAAWVEHRIAMVIEALDRTLLAPPETVVVNAQSRVRRLEGLDTRLEVARGSADQPIEVAMNGARYRADLTGGQKTGLFYDQRSNHAMAGRLAADAAGEGRSVLDVFAHVGGFGLACLGAARPAARVVAVDSSAAALALAADAAAQMGVCDRFETRRADAFDAMAAAHDAGERYGLVICDPPAFAPHKAAVEAGLRAYEKTARMAARLVAPGGDLVLCSCSGAVGAEAFREACSRGIRAAGRQGALFHTGRAGPDHPQHMALPETGYLKALFFALDG
ncbi:MAG: class I SAM-dependent methyltransferase [Pseudomonadota bacterium]